MLMRNLWLIKRTGVTQTQRKTSTNICSKELAEICHKYRARYIYTSIATIRHQASRGPAKAMTPNPTFGTLSDAKNTGSRNIFSENHDTGRTCTLGQLVIPDERAPLEWDINNNS